MKKKLISKKVTNKLDDILYFLQKYLPTDISTSKLIGIFKKSGISKQILS